MKLMCNVEVTNRLSSSSSRRRKSQRSCLAIGRQSVKNDEIHLLLQNQTNKTGTKYKISDNIENVFTKFVNEGKTTIRFKDPPHDLNIQSDGIQLKSFLHVLKLSLAKKLDPSILNLSNLNPKNLSAAPKTKITIKKASDYPILQGFSRVTEELTISGLQRRSFDRQILKLQSLRVLDLSDNKLTSLPQELGSLPSLQELNLANNQLGKSYITKWSWLNHSTIGKNLRLLNLSSNEITVLPRQISKLHHLITLNLNNNSISQLPQSIGSLVNLKYLFIAKNKLQVLPGSIRNLKLTELDISQNLFDNDNPHILFYCNVQVESLVACAARVIVQSRIYYDASIIPFTLIGYIDRTNFCLCGSPCLDSYIRKHLLLNVSSISKTVKFSNLNTGSILFDCYFCSITCLKNYGKSG